MGSDTEDRRGERGSLERRTIEDGGGVGRKMGIG